MNLNALRDEIREGFEGLLAKEEEVLLAMSRGRAVAADVGVRGLCVLIV